MLGPSGSFTSVVVGSCGVGAISIVVVRVVVGVIVVVVVIIVVVVVMLVIVGIVIHVTVISLSIKGSSVPLGHHRHNRTNGEQCLGIKPPSLLPARAARQPRTVRALSWFLSV